MTSTQKETSEQRASDDKLAEYRTHLIDLRQKVQEERDKTVLTLSGGALGLSLTFIKDIVDFSGVSDRWLLIVAWGAYTASMTIVLGSQLFSEWALGKALKQFDSGVIYESHPGGLPDILVRITNVLSSLLFILGTIFLVTFVATNI